MPAREHARSSSSRLVQSCHIGEPVLLVVIAASILADGCKPAEQAGHDRAGLVCASAEALECRDPAEPAAADAQELAAPAPMVAVVVSDARVASAPPVAAAGPPKPNKTAQTRVESPKKKQKCGGADGKSAGPTVISADGTFKYRCLVPSKKKFGPDDF
jgi:hypothetical protein